jgi:bifunctional UDP-N-acetylglucosamine pyrophosphorylase/glucosamine-1-phosphate N-acetyltransferase
MWPLGTNTPKHLLPVGGKPLLTHILTAIKQNSIQDVFVVVGFRSELIQSALGDGANYGLSLTYIHQPKWTGTASALKTAYAAVGPEPFLAVYGDLWISPLAVQKVVEKSRNFDRVMGVVRVRNPSEFGLVELKGDSLLRIAEKPVRKAAPEGWINSGIYVLDGEIFRAIDETARSKRGEFELTTSLQHVIDRKMPVAAAMIPTEDWIDVGRPWDLLEANARSLGTMTSAMDGKVEQNVVLKGVIRLERESVIRSGCYVEGPVCIGAHTVVGPNTRIRPYTAIMDRVVVGTSCEIKNSIVMNGTKIPHLSYVGDSVIGENCNLGAGTITANIRFDEETLGMRVKSRVLDTGRKKLGVIMGDDVQTGINVSILPGTRIGPGSWLGPGTIITQDVQAGHLLVARQAQITKRRRRALKAPVP